MWLLITFSFIAGIFTVLSPCVLPVLPALLAAGATKGVLRPGAIICGLVLSFTFFTLMLNALVQAIGLSANILHYVAIAVLAAFGCVLLLSPLSNWLAKRVSPIAQAGNKLQAYSDGSLGGSLLFGAALGLLWTPCAGPILAAITTLVATQAITWTAVLMTLAYSIGAGMPLFLIAYGSSQFVASSKILSSHAEGLRCLFGVIMLLTATAIALHWDTMLQQRLVDVVPPFFVEDNSLVQHELEKLRGPNRFVAATTTALGNYGHAPDFQGITHWINSPPLTLQQLHGKVVLVDFWTYSCINCLRTLPYLEKWYAQYKDKGLVVVGVHTPEFEFEKDPQNVEEAVRRLDVAYPVAQDNNYRTWLAYNNRYWPAHYLIDQNGDLRAAHFGEGAYVETENEIRQLLGLPALSKQEPTRSLRPLTPETYLGTLRGEAYAPSMQLQPNQVASYSYETPLGEDQVGLKGAWRVEGESIISESDMSQLALNFLAKQVYLVLSGSSKIPLTVYLDGTQVAQVTVDGARKYDIISTSYGRHQLSLVIPKGIRAYAFTFGDDP